MIALFCKNASDKFLHSLIRIHILPTVVSCLMGFAGVLILPTPTPKRSDLMICVAVLHPPNQCGFEEKLYPVHCIIICLQKLTVFVGHYTLDEIC